MPVPRKLTITQHAFGWAGGFEMSKIAWTGKLDLLLFGFDRVFGPVLWDQINITGLLKMYIGPKKL